MITGSSFLCVLLISIDHLCTECFLVAASVAIAVIVGDHRVNWGRHDFFFLISLDWELCYLSLTMYKKQRKGGYGETWGLHMYSGTL